jgi:hypothetical protein
MYVNDGHIVGQTSHQRFHSLFKFGERAIRFENGRISDPPCRVAELAEGFDLSPIFSNA